MIYAGGSFVTSDDVADALLRFVSAVPRNRRNQVVSVPGFLPDGQAGVVELLLGPNSQLMSQHEPVDYAEPDTATVVTQLRSQAESHEDTAQTTSSNTNANFDYDSL
jgi:hypothetical protein